MFQKYFLGLMLVVVVLMNGCAIQPVASSGEGGASLSADGSLSSGLGAYILKPLDPIYVRFSGIAEQQQLDLVINEDGVINLLHIDPVRAAGLTTSALEDKIEQLYKDGGIYKHVSVNVVMTAKIYYVQGEVLQPGQFGLMSGITLLQAIAGARGTTAYASKKVTITRQEKVYTFNIKKLEKDPSLDVEIEAGDVIKVWQKWY